MTDKEIFEKYCDKKKIDFNDWYFHHHIIKATYSYKLFKLQIAISELKQSIKDALPKWMKRKDR